MVLAGIADISSEPVLVSTMVSEMPHALSLARFDARDGSGWTTNVRHETVPLNIVQRVVLPLLDGTHDRAAMTRAVQQLVDSGDLAFNRGGEKLVDEAEIADAIEEHIKSALNSFHSAALLAPAA